MANAGRWKISVRRRPIICRSVQSFIWWRSEHRHRRDQRERFADYLRSAFDENPLQEAFYCVYLDRKNHPLGRHLITLGTVDSTLVSCREVFRGAILAGCSALVVAHNHPSGDPAPSAADIHVTRKLREAANVLEIELLDHVIVGDVKGDPNRRGVYSFREGGML